MSKSVMRRIAMQKPKPHTTVMVDALPTCDVPHCGALAGYDAKTHMGPWMYCCVKHFRAYCPGTLGLGVGQRLIPRKS